jgi:uncharacterized membrane protein (UPF0127 family)
MYFINSKIQYRKKNETCKRYRKKTGILEISIGKIMRLLFSIGKKWEILHINRVDVKKKMVPHIE